ncbi:MAG TPA: POTRA domain-containing protein, partial [Thermoanaerobaculia bacterium]|nr:POTRA domain-containing protein [Thermoanaerobaculia bacterium]
MRPRVVLLALVPLVLALVFGWGGGAAPARAQTAPPPPGVEEFREAASLDEGLEAVMTEEGPVVEAIEIRSAAPLGDLDELTALLSVEVGEPLSDDRVSRTLRNVQASGIASEIELYTRPGEGEGVVAILVLQPSVQVSEVRLAGPLGLPEEDLRRAIGRQENLPLNEAQVLAGFNRLGQLYEESGYLDADVRVRVEIDEPNRRAVVTYDVQSGPRATVRSVAFEGPTAPFTEADLVAQLRSKPGAPYSHRAVNDDADRLEGWLIGQGYRAAIVDRPAEALDHQSQSVALTYPIEVGPKVTVEVAGADLDELRKRDLLPFLGGQGYDEALVGQAVGLIRQDYQRRGHYRVEVESEEQPLDGTVRLLLTVRPGESYTLEEVDFDGNEAVSDDTLQDLMTTSRRRLLSPGSGRLVAAVLEEDLRNIRSYYALQGYGEAKVGPERVEEPAQGTLRLVIPIVEGPRRQIGDLVFEGIEALKPERLGLQLRAGGPFHPQLLDRALDILRRTYQDEGFANPQVSARQHWSEDGRTVDLTIQAIEGPRTVLDRIIVRGNQRTDSEVIRRSLRVKSGDPVSEAKLLEIQRELFHLGLFSGVEVRLTRAGLEGATRDLVVRVEEGLPRRISYGLGYEYDDDSHIGSPRGSVSFTHNNVAGRAYTLRTDVRVGLRENEPEGSFRLLFGQPYLGRYAVPTTYSLFYFDENREDWDVTRWGARVEAVRELGDRRVGLAYDYRIVEVKFDDARCGNPPSPECLLQIDEREDRPAETSSLIPSFLWDRRNDPLLATKGWSSLAQVQYAFPFLSTDGHFLKLFLQQTQYLQLTRARETGAEQLIAASLRVGGIEPLSELDIPDPELPDDPEQFPNGEIFIDERFFAGGATTHRAYSRDELGILGRTVIELPGNTFRPVGGNGLLLLNVEYRFPVFGPTLGGTVFYDAGNVWADWRDIDVGEIKQGVGVGIRWNSPVGPFRFDVGYKLDRDPYEEDSYSWT